MAGVFSGDAGIAAGFSGAADLAAVFLYLGYLRGSLGMARGRKDGQERAAEKERGEDDGGRQTKCFHEGSMNFPAPLSIL